jgi:hypothetical protein
MLGADVTVFVVHPPLPSTGMFPHCDDFVLSGTVAVHFLAEHLIAAVEVTPYEVESRYRHDSEV